MTPFRMISLLLAMSIGTGVHAQDETVSAETRVDTGNAVYEIKPDPANEDRKCVLKDSKRLVCIERDFVKFGVPVRLRDFIIIPVYDDCGGSNCGHSDTTLLVESGKRTRIDRSLKRFCVVCENSFTVGKNPNEVTIGLGRQSGYTFTARFRSGDITVSKIRLDPKEPLSDDDCSYLYEDLLDTCIGTRECRKLVADLPGANARSLRFMKTFYAAFPSSKVAAACEAACATRKKPARASFDQEICRR